MLHITVENMPGRTSTSRSHPVPIFIGIVSGSEMLKQVQHDRLISDRVESRIDPGFVSIKNYIEKVKKRTVNAQRTKK